MQRFHSNFIDPEYVTKSWIEGASKIWDNIVISNQEQSDEQSGNANASKQAFNAWEAFANQVRQKKIIENIIVNNKGGTENFQKLFKTGLDNFSYFQKKFSASTMGMDKIFDTLQKNNPEADVFNAGLEFYQNEFSKFLSIPKLGLSRTYQERANDLFDKYNVFQATFAEFLYFLYIPFEESFKVVQNKVADLAEKDALPEDMNEYYRMWLSQLENNYMELYKTKKYTTVLGKVLSAMGDFTKAKQNIVRDSLKLFGIPTEEDLDGLYKDMYKMKKRIKTLEKQNK